MALFILGSINVQGNATPNITVPNVKQVIDAGKLLLVNIMPVAITGTAKKQVAYEALIPLIFLFILLKVDSPNMNFASSTDATSPFIFNRDGAVG